MGIVVFSELLWIFEIFHVKKINEVYISYSVLTQ